MLSKNLGETQGKPDFGILFEDFPNAVPELARIIAEGDYKTALSICVLRVGWDEVLKAREYGANKYAKDNWLESKGTNDHENFMAANKRSIYRHIAAYESMDMIDQESGCKHLAMVALRAMIAIEYGVPVAGEVTISDNVEAKVGSTPTAPTLYDWSDIDAVFQWMSQDSDGQVKAFAEKPTRTNTMWSRGGVWSSVEYTTPDDWRDSLEQRPAK